VIFSPNNEAERKRIASWCAMTNKAEGELGGVLSPVTARIPIGTGLSQAILDGTQLSVSTVERTIIDSGVYTKEIGGAGEALLWTKTALGKKSMDLIELERIAKRISSKLSSITARLGFLLETALSDRRVAFEQRAPLEKLVEKLRRNTSKSRSTFNWGSERAPVEYIQNWRLHVSKHYLKQLKETA